MTLKVLLLAGTSEARHLAQSLIGDGRFDVVASLAGVTRAPADLGVETISGGFGGAEGLRTYLVAKGIDALVDATHPFANIMTRTACGVASELDLPHVILQRPEWLPQPGDDWHFVDALEQAADLIPHTATVFLGSGRQTLHSFANLSDRRLICRLIDPPNRPFPFANGRFQVGRPPFSIADEVAFFKAEGIDWLVIKNSGGDNSGSKLDAARELGLPVILQNRPALPESAHVATPEAALAWLVAQVRWLGGS